MKGKLRQLDFASRHLRRMNLNNQVGRGIAPSPSHTTTHALARGGFG